MGSIAFLRVELPPYVKVPLFVSVHMLMPH